MIREDETVVDLRFEITCQVSGGYFNGVPYLSIARDTNAIKHHRPRLGVG